jgi:hypothetical protein
MPAGRPPNLHTCADMAFFFRDLLRLHAAAMSSPSVVDDKGQILMLSLRRGAERN